MRNKKLRENVPYQMFVRANFWLACGASFCSAIMQRWSSKTNRIVLEVLEESVVSGKGAQEFFAAEVGNIQKEKNEANTEAATS